MTATARDPGRVPARPVPPPVAEAPAPGTLQSVTRALRLLELVAASREGVTAKEAATALGVALPTAYHLLTTLTETGYLVHLAADRRFGLGYQVRVLEQGLCRQLEVPAEVAGAVGRLHADADAAAYYAVYRDADVVVAHVVDSPRRPRVQVLDIGFHEATHATAFGKVLLAALEPGARRAHLTKLGMRACTRRTIVDEAALEAHLAHVRESGVALEIGEFQDGLSCLASSVRAPDGSVTGSVAISLPSPEFAARRWELERAVRHGATSVTRALRRH